MLNADIPAGEELTSQSSVDLMELVCNTSFDH